MAPKFSAQLHEVAIGERGVVTKYVNGKFRFTLSQTIMVNGERKVRDRRSLCLVAAQVRKAVPALAVGAQWQSFGMDDRMEPSDVQIGECVRITCSTHLDVDYVHIRAYFLNKQGVMCPSPTGVALKVNEVEEVVTQMEEFLTAFATEHGESSESSAKKTGGKAKKTKET